MRAMPFFSIVLWGAILVASTDARGAPADGGWSAPPLPKVLVANPSSGCAAFLSVERPAMGSRLQVQLCSRRPRDLNADAEAVFAEFQRLEGLLTTWRPDSDVSRINSAAGQHPVPVSRDTLEVLQDAQEASVRSDGLFDVTFASLGLWHFDEDATGQVPSAAAVAERLTRVGYRHLHLDPVTHTAFLDQATSRIDLGGIGKGFAVDRAVVLLRQRGLSDFLIQAGGDLYCAGHDGEHAWTVGVRDPRGAEGEFFATLEVTDAAFSTSGDYERFFIRDHRRYHHIIDPRTGYPATASRSATVLAPTATLAEELTKPMFILGPVAGRAFAERFHAEGLIIGADDTIEVSASLGKRLDVLRAPSTGAGP